MVYRTLHHLSPIYLQGTFNYTTTVTSHVGTNSYCLFVPRVRTNYAITVFITQVRKFGIHYMHPFTLQPLLDDSSLCISLIFKYIIIVCNRVYRALLKSSSLLLIAVFPLTIKNLNLNLLLGRQPADMPMQEV